MTNIRVQATRPGMNVQIVDADGDVLLSRGGKLVINNTLTLGAGTYYVQVTSTNLRPAGFSLVTITRPTVQSKRLRTSRRV